MPDHKRGWSQDPAENQNLESDSSPVLHCNGGARFCVKDKKEAFGFGQRVLGWHQGKLKLDQKGGRLQNKAQFGRTPDIVFNWDEVAKVEKIQKPMPSDRGLRFHFQNGERFIFYPAFWRLNRILDFAEERGIKVDRKARFMWGL